jgi:hypothetical protein
MLVAMNIFENHKMQWAVREGGGAAARRDS